MRRIIATAVMLVAITAPAWAGYDEGMAAYERGDYATALREWRPLAGQGNAAAQYNVGRMYANGHGVPQDYTEAAYWYRKAAEQGDAGSQVALGTMYKLGKGVPQDYAESHKWCNIVASGGVYRELGVYCRHTVAKRMTPAQIAEAQRLAREWLAKHGKK